MKKLINEIKLQLQNPTESTFMVLIGVMGWTMLILLILGGL